ncbi:MAG: 50S ribosomal protein L23 [Patescibacteria group bacterium]
MGFFNRKKNDEGQKAPAKSTAAKAKVGEKKEEAPKPAAYVTRETGSAYRVLVRPLVTEKTTALSQIGQYAFEVAKGANKLEVRKAVKSVYGVTPTGVRVITVLGKPVRSRTGMSRRSSWRKAIVTLKKGDRIDLFANA